MQNSFTSSESALADLVSLWQRRRAEGQTVTPGELCRDRPELLTELEQRIAALERMADLAHALHVTATIDPAAAPQAASDPADSRQKTLPTLDFLASSGEPVPTGWPKIPGYEVSGPVSLWQRRLAEDDAATPADKFPSQPPLAIEAADRQQPELHSRNLNRKTGLALI
jgi:hypothetical protein